MSCVACAGPLAFFGPRQGFEYFRCGECGTIQLHPMPGKDALAEAYVDYAGAGHYAETPEQSRRVNANNYTAIIEALRAHGVRGPVLDYGAGWGGLVERIGKEGLPCTGLDGNAEMVGWCREHGLRVLEGDLGAVRGERFAAIVLSTVFEHLVDHDDWLAAARELLEPGGILVSLNPTARFARFSATLLRLGRRRRELPALVELYSPPWHTVFFSLAGMERLFGRSGFELLEVRFTPSSRLPGILGWVQALLERTNRMAWSVIGPRWPLQVCHTFVFRASPGWESVPSGAGQGA